MADEKKVRRWVHCSNCGHNRSSHIFYKYNCVAPDCVCQEVLIEAEVA